MSNLCNLFVMAENSELKRETSVLSKLRGLKGLKDDKSCNFHVEGYILVYTK